MLSYMYSAKDIGVMIPTYNRNTEVDRTLKILLSDKEKPGAVYVVDQSSNDNTKKVVEKYRKKYKNIYFVKSLPPSTSKASNKGLALAKKFKIVLMLDDDVDCLPGFLDGILEEFKNPRVYGVAAREISERVPIGNRFLRNLQKLALNFFLLPARSNLKFKVLGPYGNTGSYLFKGSVRDAEWFPGINMCYRTEAIKNYKIPESRGYNLLQDIDISYYILKKYGKGSLVITDKAKVIHRYSQTERYADNKLSFVSQEDRFIFYYRFFNNFSGTLKFIWSIFGLILLKTLAFVFHPNKNNFLKLKYFVKSLIYCIKNRNNIKKGKYRTFLDENLALKV